MVGRDSGDTATSDREIGATRVFDAPRERVFEMWTKPEHLARWFGPKGFTTTTQAFDFRPGGEWRFVMRGPDGTEYENLVTYIEITPPERLHYDHGRPGEPALFQATVTFEAEGEKTRLSMRSVFATAAERDQVVRERRAIEGMHQTLDRLGELVEGRGG
jgi:uncharacterized protein YndB with AHSA1/START domain